MMERMRLVDLSPKSSYIVYITATLNVSPKETIKYEPLRIHPERFCNSYPEDLDENERDFNNQSRADNNNFYGFNHLN